MKKMMKFSANLCVLVTFLMSSVLPAQFVQAQSVALPMMPQPGAMVSVSSGFQATVLRGLEINKQNPYEIDFVVEQGENIENEAMLSYETDQLVRYFLSALTMPTDEMWVNLSPYESNRIIPDKFGMTEMGRDLLAQDYLLKQLTASLMHPDEEKGKLFWDQLYTKIYEKSGAMEIPADTFHKIWIMPGKINIHENAKGALITSSHLKVMLEEDMTMIPGGDNNKNDNLITTELMREHIIPLIEKEVNQGENFATLRQIYQSLALATWYKMRLKQTILGSYYADQQKVNGIDLNDPDTNQKIYDQYVAAFKKGVFDFIKEGKGLNNDELIPRRYFSGGFGAAGIDSAIVTSKSPLTLEQQEGFFTRNVRKMKYQFLSTVTAVGVVLSSSTTTEDAQAQEIAPVVIETDTMQKFQDNYYSITSLNMEERYEVIDYANDLTITNLNSNETSAIDLEFRSIDLDSQNNRIQVVNEVIGLTGSSSPMYGYRYNGKNYIIGSVFISNQVDQRLFFLIDPQRLNRNVVTLRADFDVRFQPYWHETDSNYLAFSGVIAETLIRRSEGESLEDVIADIGPSVNGNFFMADPVTTGDVINLSRTLEGLGRMAEEDAYVIQHENVLPVTTFENNLPSISDAFIDRMNTVGIETSPIISRELKFQIDENEISSITGFVLPGENTEFGTYGLVLPSGQRLTIGVASQNNLADVNAVDVILTTVANAVLDKEFESTLETYLTFGERGFLNSYDVSETFVKSLSRFPLDMLSIDSNALIHYQEIAYFVFDIINKRSIDSNYLSLDQVDELITLYNAKTTLATPGIINFYNEMVKGLMFRKNRFQGEDQKIDQLIRLVYSSIFEQAQLAENELSGDELIEVIRLLKDAPQGYENDIANFLYRSSLNYREPQTSRSANPYEENYRRQLMSITRDLLNSSNDLNEQTRALAETVYEIQRGTLLADILRRDHDLHTRRTYFESFINIYGEQKVGQWSEKKLPYLGSRNQLLQNLLTYIWNNIDRDPDFFNALLGNVDVNSALIFTSDSFKTPIQDRLSNMLKNIITELKRVSAPRSTFNDFFTNEINELAVMYNLVGVESIDNEMRQFIEILATSEYANSTSETNQIRLNGMLKLWNENRVLVLDQDGLLEDLNLGENIINTITNRLYQDQIFILKRTDGEPYNQVDFETKTQIMFINPSLGDTAQISQVLNQNVLQNSDQRREGGVIFNNTLEVMTIDFDGEGFKMDMDQLNSLPEINLPGLKPVFIGIQPFNVLQFTEAEVADEAV